MGPQYRSVNILVAAEVAPVVVEVPVVVAMAIEYQIIAAIIVLKSKQ